MKKICIVFPLFLSACMFGYDVPSYSKYVSSVDFDTVYVVSDKVYKISKGNFMLVHFPVASKDKSIIIYEDENLNRLLYSVTDKELKEKETEFIRINKNHNYTSDALFITKKGIIVDFKKQ